MRTIFTLAALTAMTIYPVSSMAAYDVDKARDAFVELFQKADTDHSGTITMPEYMAYHHLPVSPDYDAYYEFRAIDADDSNTITIGELYKATDRKNPTL